MTKTNYQQLSLAVAEMLGIGYSYEWIAYLMDVFGVPKKFERPFSPQSKYIFCKDLFEDLEHDNELNDIVSGIAEYIITSERFDPNFEEAALKHFPTFKRLVQRAGLIIDAQDNSNSSIKVSDIELHFTRIEDSIRNSHIESDFIKIILYDFNQSKIAYYNEAYKCCVVMLGAVLEGIMLGVLRKPEMITFIRNQSILPKIFNKVNINSPNIKEEMANRFRFEDYKNILYFFVKDLKKLGIDNIQKFRNAIHPWKAITEPGVFGNYDKTRAIHHITSLEILIKYMIEWKP